MNEALLFVCCLEMVAILALIYAYHKTVSDLTAKLMARDLYEVKSFQEKPAKRNPLDDIPKDDEVVAMEWELENARRVESLIKEAKRTGNEMLAKAWGQL